MDESNARRRVVGAVSLPSQIRETALRVPSLERQLDLDTCNEKKSDRSARSATQFHSHIGYGGTRTRELSLQGQGRVKRAAGIGRAAAASDRTSIKKRRVLCSLYLALLPPFSSGSSSSYLQVSTFPIPKHFAMMYSLQSADLCQHQGIRSTTRTQPPSPVPWPSYKSSAPN